jgi:hypothetical protein
LGIVRYGSLMRRRRCSGGKAGRSSRYIDFVHPSSLTREVSVRSVMNGGFERGVFLGKSRGCWGMFKHATLLRRLECPRSHTDGCRSCLACGMNSLTSAIHPFINDSTGICIVRGETPLTFKLAHLASHLSSTSFNRFS